MITVTCNNCGAPMAERYGHKRFHYDAKLEKGEIGFFVEKACHRFDTTGYDLCDRCFLIAVETAFKHGPRSKE